MSIIMAVPDDYKPKKGERVETRDSVGGGKTKVAISYEGAVLSTREINGYNDSDFYAMVWDEKEQEVKRIDYATTRGWTYDNNARVDATPEVIEKAQRRMVERFKEDFKRKFKRDSKKLQIGKEVTTPDGEGKVFWIGKARRYRYDVATERVGVIKEGKKYFYDAYQVTVINPEQYLPKDVEQESINCAERYKSQYHGIWVV